MKQLWNKCLEALFYWFLLLLSRNLIFLAKYWKAIYATFTLSGFALSGLMLMHGNEWTVFVFVASAVFFFLGVLWENAVDNQ